jgi:hypothetical protein
MPRRGRPSRRPRAAPDRYERPDMSAAVTERQLPQVELDHPLVPSGPVAGGEPLAASENSYR